MGLAPLIRRSAASWLASSWLAIGLTHSHGSWADQAPPRVEAHSDDILAVGVVHGETMVIHLSRTADNSPVRDATVAVTLRGTPHPARAEADGSYTLRTPELKLPGDAAVEFHVSSNRRQELLKGTLSLAGAAGRADDGSGRQLGWWILNFAACFGFLYLLSRRRKNAKEEPE